MYISDYSTGKLEVYSDSGDIVLEWNPKLYGCVWHSDNPETRQSARDCLKAHCKAVGISVDLDSLILI